MHTYISVCIFIYAKAKVQTYSLACPGWPRNHGDPLAPES